MARSSYRKRRAFRFIKGRQRLLGSMLVGLILLAALPSQMRLATRFILAPGCSVPS